MGMSEFYGSSDDQESLKTLHKAVDLGVQHFDSADTYGLGHNETLIGRFLRELGNSQRDRLVVATKFGIVRAPGRYERRIDNTPAYVRQACEASLKRLGVERIDLFYCHRRDANVPLADMMGILSDLVCEGKIAAIGLSEVSADSLRQAHALHPVAALQSEYSLWERGAEAELLTLTQALGITFVAYSPLGRAFLTDKPPQVDALEASDFRKALPRFNGQAFSQNQTLQIQLAAVATSLGVSVSKLALAWVLNRFPHTAPIPGTRRQQHLRDNLDAGALVLPPDILDTLSTLFDPSRVQGDRYPDNGWAGIETPRLGSSAQQPSES